jgi:CBS-domain-containing membrane protein
MTCHIIFCYEDQNVTDVAQLTESHQVRRLLVLSRDKRLVGIVSLGDLAIKAHSEQLVGQAVEAISEPAEVGG